MKGYSYQKPTINNVFLPIRLCFINVYTYPNPKPTPYSNADTLNIVVQREKKDENIDVRMRSKPR